MKPFGTRRAATVVTSLILLVFAGFIVGCASSSAAVTAEIERTEPDPTATTAPTPAPTTAPTSTPTPTTAPTTAPTSTPVPTPAADSDDVLPAAGTEPALADEFGLCVIGSGELDGATVLAMGELENAPATEIAETLTAEQANDVARASAECGLAEIFASTIGLPAAATDEVATCLGSELVGPDGGAVLFGLSAFGDREPVPAGLRSGFVDGMTKCVNADVFGGVIFEELVQDPQLGDLMDVGCMTDLLRTTDFIPTMWERAADDPIGFSFNDYGYEFGSGPALSCVSMGAMIALAAADEGVEISDDTVGCIDAELEASDFAENLASGAVTEEAASTAMLGCMTGEELEAFLGG